MNSQENLLQGTDDHDGRRPHWGTNGEFGILKDGKQGHGETEGYGTSWKIVDSMSDLGDFGRKQG